jgi:hypothetical protein
MISSKRPVKRVAVTLRPVALTALVTTARLASGEAAQASGVAGSGRVGGIRNRNWHCASRSLGLHVPRPQTVSRPTRGSKEVRVVVLPREDFFSCVGVWSSGATARRGPYKGGDSVALRATWTTRCHVHTGAQRALRAELAPPRHLHAKPLTSGSPSRTPLTTHRTAGWSSLAPTLKTAAGRGGFAPSPRVSRRRGRRRRGRSRPLARLPGPGLGRWASNRTNTGQN